MVSVKSLKSSVKSLKCTYLCCYFASAVCAGGLAYSINEYANDIKDLNNNTYSSEDVLAKSNSDINSNIAVSMGGMAAGVLSLTFLIIGGMKRKEADSINEYVETAYKELLSSDASLT